MTAASRLDDPEALGEAGPRIMLGLAGALGTQLHTGFDIGRTVADPPEPEGLRAIVACGMGGSGIAGDVLRSLYADRLGVPLLVVKGHVLPEFCGRETLVLASSFSGNTEETLAVYAEAVARGCRVVAFSAGGELASLAEADLVTHVPLPGDVPMPRAALGYLAGAPLGVLDAVGMVPPAEEEVTEAAGVLDALAAELGPEVPAGPNEAKGLAGWLEARTPVIWGSEGIAEAAALRWKTQVNENAKGPAWSAVLPELDHNEVEGWAPGSNHGRGHAVVVLRHPGEDPRASARVKATIESVRPSGLEVREVEARGRRPLQWLLSLVMLGDFTTTYLGVARGVDPMPIPVLTGLKERLRR